MQNDADEICVHGEYVPIEANNWELGDSPKADNRADDPLESSSSELLAEGDK